MTAGSSLSEPGGPVHTLTVPADDTERTILTVRVAGTNIHPNEDATFHPLLDAVVLRHLTDEVSRARGTPVRSIGGGATDYATSD